MASLMAGVMLLVLAAPGPDAAVCDWMSGAAQKTFHPYFANVAAAQDRGDYERAVAGFVARSEQIARQAEKTCFEQGGATLEETEQFMDKFVRGERPLLFARRDQFALAAEMVAWGAWLACRDGKLEVATGLLRAGWRDWASPGLQIDAAFLMLANGAAERAADFLGEKSDSVAGMVAQGIFNCRTGKRAEGLTWFDKADAATGDEELRGRIKELRGRCSK